VEIRNRPMPRRSEARSAPAVPPPARPFRWRRLLPLAVLALLAAGVYAMGWHRALSLETLVRHRAALDAFISGNTLAALAAFMAIYVAIVALSIPASLLLTISGGILFGPVLGLAAVVIAATTGAAIVFSIAKSAVGEHLVRRAGPLAEAIAAGFRADAFSYLLFLRLVPLFPFFLVNLAPALAGVSLRIFVAATALGVIPGAFAFVFVGSGLDSAIDAQEAAYRACLAAGRADCRLDFDLKAAVTPQLLAALGMLGVFALVPVAVRRLKARRVARSPG
jgi:uncharacterized membrane protein YdjX (TVP38/TMEM64 family)